MQLKCVRVALGAVFVLLFVAIRSNAQTSSIGTVSASAGWLTFGQAVPQGVAPTGNALKLGSFTTQTDVKSRWPDGSIKFALVTVNVPTAGSYAIGAAAAPSGTFTPDLPTASITLTIGGVAYIATLPTTPSADRWISGPLAYEGRSVVKPVASGGEHPFLRVNFDTRVYSNGKGRVDVSVENVLDKAGATTVTYDVAIVVNGQTVFTKAGVEHYYLTRWRKVFPIGDTLLATITPDFRAFNLARMLPAYLSLVDNQVSEPVGAAFDILKSGALDRNMPAHGGRAELAPYPDWTARYLVHRNQTQRSYVLANGDLSGSWPIHVREAEESTTSGVGTERLVSLTQRPTLWYDGRAQGAGLDFVKGSPMPIREYGSLDPGPGQSPLIPDNAHQPSLAYVPYLITGDRYYTEEMAFWANYGMLRTYPADTVRGGDGILAYNEVRGIGWPLRNLVEAAAVYPDGPVKAYLSEKATKNLEWLDAFANKQDPVTNPFKVMWIGKRPDGEQFIALWEQNYLAYAIDRALKLGFTAGQAHRDAIAKFQLRLFTSGPDYPKAQGAPYIVAVGTPPPNSGGVWYGSYDSFGFFTSMAQIWAGTQGNEREFAGFYGPEARLNLMMGVEAGWAGAQGAYDYLWPFIAETQFWGALPDLAQRAGWALDFYPTIEAAPPPPPPPPPAPPPPPPSPPPSTATVTLDRTHLQFAGVASGAAFATKTPVQTVHVIKTGTGAVTWYATSNRSWLTVSPASGSGFAELTIGINYAAGLPLSGNVSGAILVTATGASNAPGSVSVTLSVYSAGRSSAPFGAFDTPTNNATGLNGSIAVTGWALDDVAVTAVRIMRDPVAGEPAGQLRLVGNATFVDGARPDVAGGYPTHPIETRAGWGLLMLTNGLPGRGNGTYKLYAYADDGEGHSTLLGTRTITCDNAHSTLPFGAIDTPGQGATVSGNVNNFGWVLSPGTARADGAGGGSVSVFIDGAVVGTPVGWSKRADLAAFFPVTQYAGVDFAAGVYSFDSTTLSNGLHTIAWGVTDSNGNSAGVGSRFFWVWNGLAPPLTATLPSDALSRVSSLEALPIDRTAIAARRGFDLDASFHPYIPDVAGRVTLIGEELDRFELQLDGSAGGYSGYLRTPGGVSSLPIGSVLDSATSVFSWQPGAGFVGRYQFVFVRDEGGRPIARRDVEILLYPKGSLSTPHVVIDTPRTRQDVGQSFAVGGWALDQRARGGSGIDAIHVWAYPLTGDPIFLGDAALGGARPDVAAIYGQAGADSGYGLTVRSLMPGAYMIAVFAHSIATGTFLPAAIVQVVAR